MHPRLLLLLLLALPAAAQDSSSSSSSPGKAPAQESSSSPRVPRGPEASGAAITLETSEPLFSLAAALNACGYDSDLANSNPVRQQIRTELTAADIESPAPHTALCAYIQQHQLADRGRDLAQYLSLSLYITPALTPAAEQTDMPPDALQVVNILPLLRTWATAVNLHTLWLLHRPQYEAITDRVHDPVTQMILATNIYLRVPVSSYDGRRLLILVEPLLAPSAPNARIYSSDYIVVTSPNLAGAIRMDQIRHLYLHYEVEPLVYARAQSMTRLAPLLKAVADAPLDYIYKSDVIALVTECLIKAIEARTLDVGPPPGKPTGARVRTDNARYTEELASYDRQAEIIRRKAVDLDMRQGWTLTDYFYTQLLVQERESAGLSERMGEMVYGMDVDRERHRDEQIVFLPEGSSEFVRRAPRVPTGLLLAEKKMLEGSLDDAMELAERALADPKQDHAQATYVKARVQLLEGNPETSTASFKEVLKLSANPNTLAWTHIYLGRLFDAKDPQERQQAVAEYKLALATPGLPPDAKEAASTGLKSPFIVPRTIHREEEPLDPSGKAEKQSYKPE